MGIADHDLNTALIDGTVKPEGFELDIAHSADDGAIHQLLRDGKIDACEYSFGRSWPGKRKGYPSSASRRFPIASSDCPTSS